jgi:hypothetical protein
VVPTLTITSPANNTIFNASNYNSLSISGDCNKNGATVTLTGDVSGTLTTTCNGTNYSLSGLTLTGDDGSKTVTATIADTAGNSSQLTLTLQKDTVAPTAILIGAPTSGSYSNATSLSVNVIGADVSEYLYKFGDSSTTDCSIATGYSNATPHTTPISIDSTTMGADGGKRLCVRAKDASGNVQALTSATQVTWTKDTIAPTLTFTSPNSGSFVNGVSQSSFTVSGTCTEVGRKVKIDGDITPSVEVDCVSGTPNNTWTANLNFSGASDGPVFILISQTDAAGNVSSKTRSFVKDTLAPTVSWTSPQENAFINNANKASFTVQGNCSEYSATPNILLTSSALTASVSVACNGTTWTANLAFNNGDENVTVTATITDAAGNSSSSSRVFRKDTTNPVVAITSPSPGSYINNANKASFAVSGTCSEVGTNNVVISGDAAQTVNCVSGNTWTANLNFTAQADGSRSITVTHTDAAGNTHTASLALVKDVVPPALGWTLPLDQSCVSTASAANLPVSGTCTTSDGNVTLSSAQLSSSVTASCSGGNWSANLNLNVTSLNELQLFTVQVSQTDQAGNSSTLTRSFKKIGSTTPTVIFGGWDDIYAVGPKTYASNPQETTPDPEPGKVRISWKEWPAGNTCMPEAVKVYRASEAGGAGTLVSDTDYPNGIPVNVRSFTDNTLMGATLATVNSPTDFGKGWYYKLKVTIAGNDYDVNEPSAITEVRVIAPPPNMALVHRWIANQEVCGLMNRTTDPQNHYRCNYSGWGKVTVGGQHYYDLEKDLLVDRHELGCNFTSQCGPSYNQPGSVNFFVSVVFNV